MSILLELKELNSQSSSYFRNSYFTRGIQPSEYFFMKQGSDSVYAFRERILEEYFEDFIYDLYHIHQGYY